MASPHGVRIDPYYWLRDDERANPEVLAYLAAENAYRERRMSRTKPFEDTLYQEIVARLKQDDSSVPYLKRGYWYHTRFEPGKEHPIFARVRYQYPRLKYGTLESSCLRRATISSYSAFWKGLACDMQRSR